MPTELLHREIIYCREWYNAATNEYFRLSIIPERKIGGDSQVFTPTGGFKLRRIPNSIIKETTEFESSLKDLRIGMIETPTINLTLNTDSMPVALKYIVLTLENPTIVDDKYYTNTWLFQSDRGTDRTNWYNEFIGVQRKTPGMRLKLYRGGEVPRTEVEITLVPLSRFILESVQMASICEKANNTTALTGLGVLNSSGILTSYPFDLDLHVNKIRITGFISLTTLQAPVNGSAYLRPLSLLYYIIWHEQQLLLRKYLRNNSINLTYENAWGERRFPHDNIKCRNLLGNAFVDPDKLYYISTIAGDYNGESVEGGGKLMIDKDTKGNFAEFLNVYDFFSAMAENFPSAFIYYNNIGLDIATFPEGAEELSIATLDYSGKMHFNFSRLKENINKTDDVSSPFNLTTAQRSISVLRNINDSIEIEQGASLIRSVTAERSATLGVLDTESIEVRTDSILSEQEYSIKTLFETGFNLPERFKVLRNSGGDTVVGVTDLTGFDSGLLYYYDGTESTLTGIKPRVYKVHEVVSYITNANGDTVTYDDVDEINTLKVAMMTYFDTAFGEKLKYDFEPNGNSPEQKTLTFFADHLRRIAMSEILHKSGLCFSAAKYVLENFSKRNQSVIEMSLDNSVPIQSNWLGDFFSIGYWDIIDSYIPYIQSNAALISIKKDIAKGTTEVKFLTEGI